MKTPEIKNSSLNILIISDAKAKEKMLEDCGRKDTIG
jgi:hypothetical protein